MGFFGWVRSKLDKVAEVASKVADKVKETGRAIKEKVTNVWNKFSGKENFEKAKKLYDEICDKYDERREAFTRDVDDITNKIEDHVDKINSYKAEIKTELFIEMANKIKKIKDVKVNNDFSIEYYDKHSYEFDNVRSESQLFKIDFNKNKFKTTIQVIFTLGFYTRKKAKETLLAVQEEKDKINHEITKMDAEIEKLQKIEAALNNSEYYFESLTGLYRQLLIRLDNSVNCLYFKSMQSTQKIISQEVSLKKLPLVQQKEIEAIITASIILKEMVIAKIVSIEKATDVKTYQDGLSEQHSKFVEKYEAA